MTVDFFENGLCFFCHMAKNELAVFGAYHAESEEAWREKDGRLQDKIAEILERTPKHRHDDLVDSYGEDLHAYQTRYPDIHRKASVIAIYVFLEDQLNDLCDLLATSTGQTLRYTDLDGKGVERAFSYLSKVMGFKLGEIPELAFVKHANDLRNRLVHAGGVLPEVRWGTDTHALTTDL